MTDEQVNFSKPQEPHWDKYLIVGSDVETVRKAVENKDAQVLQDRIKELIIESWHYERLNNLNNEGDNNAN